MYLIGEVHYIEIGPGRLMNDFPCLFIWCICDYTESRKNDDGQGHSAAAATGGF